MIPIAILRVRIGLDPADTASDTQLTLADTIATSILETWLDRRLPLGAESETFTHHRGGKLSLRRYPIVTGSVVITGTEIGFPAFGFHVDNQIGQVYFDGRPCDHQFTVAYTGGYVELPPDLLAVSLLVFDSVWDVLTTTEDAGVEVGAIRSITVPDVGTIAYATGSDGSASVQGSSDYGIPTMFAGIVDRHRRIYA